MKQKGKLLIATLFTLALVLSFASTVSAASIKLNKSKMQLNIGVSTTLKITGTSKKATWKSSNKSIASVSSSGKVTTKKAGKVVITSTVNNKAYECNITVNKSKPTNKTTYYIGTHDNMQLTAPSLTGKITWTSNKPNVVSVSKTGVISSPLRGNSDDSAIITASTKTKKHYFYIYVDGSYLSRSEILLFEDNTAKITMDHDYLHDKYTIKVGDTSIAKSELNKDTDGFSFEVTGVKPGTTTITVVGDKKRTYKLKVTVVKKNDEVPRKVKEVVDILENKYEMIPNENDQTKNYILNPEDERWVRTSITVSKDNEYVGLILPSSVTGNEAWLSIAQEVIEIMSPMYASSLYDNIISDGFISSSKSSGKVLEGMNVMSLYYLDRYLVFESGELQS